MAHAAGRPLGRRTWATSSVSAAGRDSVDPAGLADGLGPQGLELLAELMGQPSQRRIVELGGQFEAFVAAVGFDVGGLTVQIDRVFGVDLKLLGDLRRELARTAARCARLRSFPGSDRTAVRTRCGAGRPD